ncbi:MAG: double-strand break repair protein AddB [Novosphingobium sp.]|nr:double-strand break repair protein AddB [Novosphingobium sp.]
MAERPGPQLYSIAAHRGFADALVAGLIPRYAEPRFGLARLTLLLPSRRAVRTVTEAFVRASGSGLLLPRMAVIGDLDLDETLGPLLDPLGAGADIPPAADTTPRWLRLAEMLREEPDHAAAAAPALLRLARKIARSMDRLAVEGIPAGELLSDRVRDLFPDLAGHWQANTRLFAVLQQKWRLELEERGEIDAPERRNRLLDHAARRWRESPPPHPVVAAGVTSASPAIARLLRVVAELSKGAVILPDLDLAMGEAVWDALGVAGAPDEADGEPFARGDAVTHPQYHLKLLLNRMGVGRGEVQPWHRSGSAAAPPERSRAISSLFLPPEASAAWIALPPERRRLSGVRLMECADPEEEAQAIALLVREALETPEKRVAVVTPDRNLAARVSAHLARWNVAADDSAGRPLSQTAAGRLVLSLADCLAERMAPVPLLAALGHPLVRMGEARAEWLERVRELDRVLRGPRPAPGLSGIARAIAGAREKPPLLPPWWRETADLLEPLDRAEDEASLAELLDRLAAVGEALCGTALWAQPDGRALAAFVEDLRDAAREAATRLDPRDLPAVLREAMEELAVRPPWGGHPRVAIYGLLEARMSRADLAICGGLVEGKWPARPAPDPLLAPALLRALGVPGADFRIGLSAHDLAAALGAPEVVLSHAARDEAGPTIPSRFLLRIRAMLGPKLLKAHRETRTVELARAVDRGEPAPAYPRPQARPSAEQRRVAISATALDRLRGDPYQFYASTILGLSPLDALDAEPSAAWKGTAVHAILERWHEQGGDLAELGARMLAAMSAHPFTKATWQPRLLRALEWIAAETARLAGEGRTPVLWEKAGAIEIDGVRIHGKADRIDRLDGALAVVDYKTGAPPTNAQVEKGFNLQLGVLGLIAAHGGFAGLSGAPERFEYWSLGRSKNSETGFGYRCEPIKEGRKLTGLPREEFLSQTEFYLRDALARWILGDEPFTARLNPDLPGYGDYDQLMRLDEWQARGDAESGGS